MHKPDANPENIQMTDILCDFCRREWTEEVAMVEGHRGSCICGRCLTLAYMEVVVEGEGLSGEYRCPMCQEGREDREVQKRGEDTGWRSPVEEEAVICRRCIKQAAGALHKDEDSGWRKPTAGTPERGSEG